MLEDVSHPASCSKQSLALRSDQESQGFVRSLSLEVSKLDYTMSMQHVLMPDCPCEGNVFLGIQCEPLLFELASLVLSTGTSWEEP